MWKICIVLLCFISFFQSSYAGLSDLIDDWAPSTHICEDSDDCWFDKWVEVVKDAIQWAETEKKASEYIQDIVIYVLSFMAIVAVLYIIYAWFNILTAAWDDDKVTQSKKTIMYVALWLLVMFLAASIVGFIFGIFDGANELNNQVNNFILK